MGLQYVDAGRSSILGYTTMIWVTPVALFLGEKLNWQKVLGLLLGIFGIVLLFSPWEINWSNPDVVFGNFILLLAAMSWAVAMLFIRFGKWHSDALELLPWQLLLATIPAFIIAIIKEPAMDIQWTMPGTLNLLFNAIFANVFAVWGVIEVGKRLPVTTVSICLLGVPVVGLVSSMIFLGEAMSVTAMIAAMFLLGGLGMMALAERKPANTDRRSAFRRTYG